jgi:hypothetical protein
MLNGSGVQIPTGARDSLQKKKSRPTVGPTQPPPPGSKAAGACSQLSHFQLVPMLRMGVATPTLPPT